MKAIRGSPEASSATALNTIAHPESSKRNPSIFKKAPADSGIASL
jgi:hypothetical protein